MKKMVGLQAKQGGVVLFRTATECSERHACGQMGVLRAYSATASARPSMRRRNERLRTRLLELAARRRGDTAEVLRARPVEGDIDHEKLTCEIVARFPKILAALAK